MLCRRAPQASDKFERSLRILVGYAYFPNRIDIRTEIESWLSRLRDAGFCVQPFVLTLNPPSERLSWAELDLRWRRRDYELLSMYAKLHRKLVDYDVFVNWNGINIHPDVLSAFPTFNVFACFDDPEASDDLSRPVASSYDCCLVGNIACLDMYKQWGAQAVGWWPLGFHLKDYDPELTIERILNGARDADVTLLCERLSNWRSDRLSRFVEAFPSGHYFGSGWPSGFLPESQRVPLLQRTKIGLNVHNSSGPVNYRTFYLPANGVLQLCDNTSHLCKVFEVNREVVGYDTIDEAVEKCRYYLTHDSERREIAARGFERAILDYNEVAVFRRVQNQIVAAMQNRGAERQVVPMPRASKVGTLLCALERRVSAIRHRLG